MSPLSARMSTDRYSLGQRQKTVQSSFLSPQGNVVTLLLLLRVPISYQTTLLFCFDSVSECSVWLLPPSSSSPVLYTPTTPRVCVLAKGECVPVRIYLSATPRPHRIADSSATAWNIGLWITWIIKYNYQCLWTSAKTNYNSCDWQKSAKVKPHKKYYSNTHIVHKVLLHCPGVCPVVI